ncbi:MAG: hydrogenase maturation nickel metallochaperone HypA [Candidatus Acidiferrum sp.]|jgi:hydrogenase nickel incorporation protein HypA/HybF
MHELSIAVSIVEMAQEEAESRGVQVQAVHLRLGGLSGVVKEALLSSYEMACHATPLEGSQLLIEEVPIEVFCPNCQVPRLVSSIRWMCCPDCATPTPTVLRGKELEVVALEIKDSVAVDLGVAE